MRPFTSYRDQSLQERSRFFRRHMRYHIVRTPGRAVLLARAEERAEDAGIEVSFKPELIECLEDPRPALWVWGCARLGSETLAHLGCIGLASWRDPYARVVAAQLCQEALERLYGK